jgi:lipopolysaccharide/colanic/teichoic acid biosynthesis glycosyltransferase
MASHSDNREPWPQLGVNRAADNRSWSTVAVSKLLKRVFDIVVAATLLGLLSPVIAAVSVVIRRTMGPPVIFRQQRPGLGGRIFTLYKFRTMRAGPGTDAERLTDVGRFVRSTSLDELPQLWNVLKGDMSLVGPRPLLPQYLDRYSERQARRHQVRPGITGLAQVSGRNALSWEDRLELDVRYVERLSLLLDAEILARTALSVLRREGISASDHATMPEFAGAE